MKATRIIAAGVVVLGLALAATWLARDRIIERLTGPMLERYGWVISDVSLDALATRDASIGYIELAHESGTIVAVDDLVLAVRKSSAGRLAYHAARVTVTLPETGDGDSPDVAAAIRQLLGLPAVLADVDVTIGELRADGFPGLSDVAWSTFPRRQLLRLHVAESSVQVDLLEADTSAYEARLEFSGASGENQRVDLLIDDRSGRIRLSAAAELGFVAWRAWLEGAGMLPDGSGVESGSARVEALLEIPDGPDTEMALHARLQPGAVLQFRLDDNLAITARDATPVDVVASLPGGAWTIDVDAVHFDIDSPIAGNLELGASSIACHNGVACTFELSARAEQLAPGEVGADAVELSGHLDIEVDPEAVSLSAIARPGAVIKASGVSGNDVRAARVVASFVSETTISRAGAGWQFKADSVDMEVEGLDAGDTRSTASLFLEGTSLTSSAAGVVGRTGLFVPSVAATYGDFALKLPGIRGDVTLADQRLVAELQTVGLHEEGSMSVSSDFASGEGQARLDDAVNDFAARPLSKLVSGGWEGFDLTAGSFRLNAGIRWQRGAPMRGESTLLLANVAGVYSATAFTGVDTVIDFAYDGLQGLEAKPASITATLLDIGIALRELSARYQLWPGEEAVDIAELQMKVFGGTITADPFRLDTSGDDQAVLVHARSVNLAQMLSIQEFDKVEVTGYVDADLPVTLTEGGVRVADGRLTGISPGGVIRYRDVAPAADANSSALGFAASALSNFEYEMLTSDVNYDENGNLALKMQIRGSNPDFENGRPIVLNLGVENNVRDMLRSLQATRSAQDVIERRINR